MPSLVRGRGLGQLALVARGDRSDPRQRLVGSRRREGAAQLDEQTVLLVEEHAGLLVRAHAGQAFEHGHRGRKGTQRDHQARRPVVAVGHMDRSALHDERHDLPAAVPPEHALRVGLVGVLDRHSSCRQRFREEQALGSGAPPTGVRQHQRRLLSHCTQALQCGRQVRDSRSWARRVGHASASPGAAAVTVLRVRCTASPGSGTAHLPHPVLRRAHLVRGQGFLHASRRVVRRVPPALAPCFRFHPAELRSQVECLGRREAEEPRLSGLADVPGVDDVEPRQPPVLLVDADHSAAGGLHLQRQG